MLLSTAACGGGCSGEHLTPSRCFKCGSAIGNLLSWTGKQHESGDQGPRQAAITPVMTQSCMLQGRHQDVCCGSAL